MHTSQDSLTGDHVKPEAKLEGPNTWSDLKEIIESTKAEQSNKLENWIAQVIEK